MATQPRIVVIGAGIVGCALADELTRRGRTHVTVLDQGPLFTTGGSTSHAPGLVFRTTGDRTMTRLADATVTKYSQTTLDGARCFRPVGGLEVAATPERLTDLHRRHGWAAASGIGSRVIDAAECARLHPLIDASTILVIGLALQTAVLSGWLAVRDPGTLRAIARSWRQSLPAGFAGAFASQAWFLAFALESAATVRTQALVEILFAQFLAGKFLKERAGPREWLGIAAVVLGVVLLLNG